ncbi:TIGR01621 family pseudouridine synthase [Photobacterium gaetbulicola]|uniref:Putative pseudouridine synthase Rlu family protein n=1 Tax=Photobacterium gaetbulicola Gung47 TaxID=658445 RepID=A0A0C5X212_9GAMM|nr:TIGR01621 family pseudouridine synthase [Photobacterium gaetbulicola]AJR09380.1 putative pseudouridine synthase Rlu family protein [Photobacterium gaetbulicola Gung47]PSU14183.1 TIGR01621 family pseudouridine synthase [Photobacterium gaetbulicola]
MFDILHTHPDFLVINKHPDVSVHKDDGEVMLLQEVAKQSGDAQLYLIHRLDKMTSGILLLGRNREAAAKLSANFAERDVEKFYVAIGSKKPKKKQGVVIGDMTRSRRSSWKLENSRENPAITQFFSAAAGQGRRLFLCKPHTGKTHQIRVALRSVGSGISGDTIYGNELADRGYLHAYALCFEYAGYQWQFICPPEQGELWHLAETQLVLAEWATPWALAWPVLPGKR